METAKQTTLTVNGVNVTQLFDTIEVIKDNPEVSKFKFRATNRWQAGTQNRATMQSFYRAMQ